MHRPRGRARYRGDRRRRARRLALTGPVFDAWGAVYDDVDPDYMPPVDEYRALFDVWVGPEDATVANPRFETLARFMNMHARAGVDPEAMQLALVIHGSAGRAALNDEAYRARFGSANPDRPLLDALAARGVRVLICGQSAAYRGYAKDEMIAPVDVAVSAYSANLRPAGRGLPAHADLVALRAAGQ